MPRFFTGLRSVIVTSVAVAATGVACGIAVIALCLYRGPHDLRRIGTILGALNEGAGRGNTAAVVFGDSVSMSGYNMDLLSSATNSRYNLASGGQSVSESALYYQALNPGSFAIQTVSWASTWAPGAFVSSKIAAGAVAFGYRAEPQTMKLIGTLHDRALEVALEKSNLRTMVELRWLVRNSIDLGIRQLLRKDLALGTSILDTRYPNPYVERVAPSALEVQLKNAEKTIRQAAQESEQKQRAFFQDLVALSVSKHILKFVVMNPIHPRLREHFPQEIAATSAWLRMTCDRAGIPFMDATEFIGSDGFIDAVHLNREAASVLTSQLNRRLNERRL